MSLYPGISVAQWTASSLPVAGRVIFRGQRQACVLEAYSWRGAALMDPVSRRTREIPPVWQLSHPVWWPGYQRCVYHHLSVFASVYHSYDDSLSECLFQYGSGLFLGKPLCWSKYLSKTVSQCVECREIF